MICRRLFASRHRHGAARRERQVLAAWIAVMKQDSRPIVAATSKAQEATICSASKRSKRSYAQRLLGKLHERRLAVMHEIPAGFAVRLQDLVGKREHPNLLDGRERIIVRSNRL